jgi:hypothetical protein
MIRTLYPYSGLVDYGALLRELRAVDATVIDTNEVDGQVAVYTPDDPDTAALEAVVAAHTGPPLWPALDTAGSLATLLVVEGVLPIEDAANSQHTTPEHLIAEAEAWAVAAP